MRSYFGDTTLGCVLHLCLLDSKAVIFSSHKLRSRFAWRTIGNIKTVLRGGISRSRGSAALNKADYVSQRGESGFRSPEDAVLAGHKNRNVNA